MKTVLNIRRVSIAKLKTLQDHHDRNSGKNENCNPARKHLNVTMIGHGQKLQERAKQKIERENIKFDKRNEVPITTFVFSASPEYFTDNEATRKWVQATVAFIKSEVKANDILRMTLHRDETTDHIHLETLPTYLKKTKRGETVWGSHQKSPWGGTLGYQKFLDRYAKAVEHLGIQRGEAPVDRKNTTPTSKADHARKILMTAEKTMITAEEKLRVAEQKLADAASYQAAVKASAEAIIEEQIVYRPSGKNKPEGLSFGKNQPKEKAERETLANTIKPAFLWAVRFAKKIYDMTSNSGGLVNQRKITDEEVQRDKLVHTIEAAKQIARSKKEAKSSSLEKSRARSRQAEL